MCGLHGEMLWGCVLQQAVVFDRCANVVGMAPTGKSVVDIWYRQGGYTRGPGCIHQCQGWHRPGWGWAAHSNCQFFLQLAGLQFKVFLFVVYRMQVGVASPLSPEVASAVSAGEGGR